MNVPRIPIRGKKGQLQPLPIQRLAVDPKDLRSGGDVPYGVSEHASDIPILQLLERWKIAGERTPFACGCRFGHEQVAWIDHWIDGQCEGTLDHVFQLTNVAGEAVPHQVLQSFLCDADVFQTLTLAVFVEKEADELRK